MVPARSHKPNDVGSNPILATKIKTMSSIYKDYTLVYVDKNGNDLEPRILLCISEEIKNFINIFANVEVHCTGTKIYIINDLRFKILGETI